MKIMALGSNAAVPAHDRHLSAQLIQSGNSYLLVDCGEASQFQLHKAGISVHKISAVFISHLHGDHIFGLPGLITSMSLQSRSKPLDIYAHSALEDFLRTSFLVCEARINFELRFHPIETTRDALFSDDFTRVSCFPLSHRIACVGFRFDEQSRPPKLVKSIIDSYKLDVAQIQALKRGEDLILTDGRILLNKDLTIASGGQASYAYCTDTIFLPELKDVISGVKLLYHEATFAESEKEKSKLTYHTTAKEAAQLAALAGVEKLLIGHFSSRYPDLRLLENEAREIFPNSHAIQELIWYEL